MLLQRWGESHGYPPWMGRAMGELAHVRVRLQADDHNGRPRGMEARLSPISLRLNAKPRSDDRIGGFSCRRSRCVLAGPTLRTATPHLLAPKPPPPPPSPPPRPPDPPPPPPPLP